MTINRLKLTLALVLVPVLGNVSLVQSQPVPAMRLVDATAPGEVIACTGGTVPDGSQSSLEDAIVQADKHLMDEAGRLRVERIGDSFVNQIDQPQDAEPLDFELCRSIGERPVGTTNLTFHELPPRAMRVGYCPATDPDQCREALKAALAPAPVVGNQASSSPPPPPPFAVTRVATWNGALPPSSTSQMLDAVVRLSPLSVQPQAGAGGQPGDAVEVKDEEARPIGAPGNARAASRRIEAPAHRPATGFVFAVSK